MNLLFTLLLMLICISARPQFVTATDSSGERVIIDLSSSKNIDVIYPEEMYHCIVHSWTIDSVANTMKIWTESDYHYLEHIELNFKQKVAVLRFNDEIYRYENLIFLKEFHE